MSRSACPNEANHTDTPEGYAARVEWLEAMAESHVQVECYACHLLVIWVPKPAEAG